MKSIHKLLFACFAIAVFSTGCNDEFLDVQPKGTLSGDALSTPEGVEALATAAYAGLAQNFDELGPKLTFFHPPSNWSFGDIRSGDAYKGGGGVGDISEYHNLELSDIRSTNSTIARKWKAVYFGIARCNKALAVLNEADEAIVPQKNARIGEMKFLRGHFYFDLMKNFGSFVRIDEVMGFEEINAASNSLDKGELWGYIEQDFKDAIANLPETADAPGRANKYAAHAYLCKAHIFQSEWQEALDQADIVINSGKYGLLPTFTDVFKLANEQSEEHIFSIEFSTNDGSQFGNINWGNLLNSPRGPAYNGDGFHRPSQNMINAFKTDPFSGLPLFDTFNDEDLTNDFVDYRLDHTTGRVGIPWYSFDKVFGESWCRNLEDYGCTAVKKTNIDPNDPNMIAGWPWGGSPLNWYLIRYADLLLWKAEALVELNKDLDVARGIVNQIRQRALDTPIVLKLDGSGPAANYKMKLYQGTNWTQAYARQAIRFERRLELAQEGHRFYDLVRWGVAADELNNYYEVEKTKRTYLVSANFTANKNEYLPIPQEEIDRSGGVLKQIAGY